MPNMVLTIIAYQSFYIFGNDMMSNNISWCYISSAEWFKGPSLRSDIWPDREVVYKVVPMHSIRDGWYRLVLYRWNGDFLWGEEWDLKGFGRFQNGSPSLFFFLIPPLKFSLLFKNINYCFRREGKNINLFFVRGKESVEVGGEVKNWTMYYFLC